MYKPKGTRFVSLVVGLAVIAPLVRVQETKQSEREARKTYPDFALQAPLAMAVSARAAEAPSRYAKLDGHRVHYKSYGKGKEALVFIHGWACDLTFWRMQAPVYEKQRSLLVDLPGHSLSDKPEIAYTFDLFARAVEAVMRDAGVKKAVLVGHSMGAPVAVTFLRRYPEKASGLVIVDLFFPPPPKDDAERKKIAEQSAVEVKMYRSPDYKTPMARMIDSMSTPQTPAALRDEIRTKMLATPQHVAGSALEGRWALAGMLQPRLKDARFDLPVLAIMATRGGQPGYEQYLRSVFSNLRGYQEWEGVGHFLMMEQPEKFNAALLEFFDRREK